MIPAVILIPALNPGRSLIEYCHALMDAGFSHIILVDDGSNRAHKNVFDALKEEVTVLTHPTNLGKGCALKTGFRHILDSSEYQASPGVITLDADGQFSVEDALRVNDALCAHPDSLVLGERDLRSASLPAMNKRGNFTARILFQLLYGAKLSDTQSGLRGIPSSLLASFSELDGTRFEYETNILLTASRSHVPIESIPVPQIYQNGTHGRHARKLSDSLRIYWLLISTFFRYMMTSLVASGVDLILFSVFNPLFHRADISDAGSIFLATAIARIISATCNFLLTKRIAFHNKEHSFTMLMKFYLLCAVQLILSASLVFFLFALTGWQETVLKVFVDVFLFCVCYRIQQRYIFNAE